MDENRQTPYIDDAELMNSDIGDKAQWPATPYIEEEVDQ